VRGSLLSIVSRPFANRVPVLAMLRLPGSAFAGRPDVLHCRRVSNCAQGAWAAAGADESSVSASEQPGVASRSGGVFRLRSTGNVNHAAWR
jgi:hypothetical protein